ncbi:MAG TPA: class I tRNA ligase family protein, partial [Actinomycetota bacterium]|nr:class I tRNA ligase family protein [Actinomycetota bacterium]
YWPAMLLSAGVPLPTEIFVHGYLTIAGQKISKSLGNVIDPIALAEEFGSDSLRYYLLRRFPAADDGDFTRSGLIRTHNSELADQLGNLLSRVEALVGKYYDGIVPAAGAPEAIDTALIAKAEQVPAQVRAALDNFQLHNAAAAVWELIAEANRYIVTIEPWKLAKERSDPNVEARIASCLYNLVELLRLAAGWSHAFIPESSTRILERIGVAPAAAPFAEFGWGRYPAGTKLEGGPPLFPKREIDTT